MRNEINTMQEKYERAIALGKNALENYAWVNGSFNFVQECIQASERRLREIKTQNPASLPGGLR